MSSGFRRLEKHGNRTSSNTKSQKKTWTKERIQAAREESARKKENEKNQKGCKIKKSPEKEKKKT